MRYRGLFDPGEVTRLIEVDRTGAIEGSYTIFTLPSLELWCRSFLDSLAKRSIS